MKISSCFLILILVKIIKASQPQVQKGSKSDEDAKAL